MAGLEKEIVILSAARTSFGKFCRALKDLTATELGVIAARAAIERAGVRQRRSIMSSLAMHNRPARTRSTSPGILASRLKCQVCPCPDRESDPRLRISTVARSRSVTLSVRPGLDSPRRSSMSLKDATRAMRWAAPASAAARASHWFWKESDFSFAIVPGVYCARACEVKKPPESLRCRGWSRYALLSV
jgi:hypothetical protein